MADLSRPIAPYLPPEITARIIDLIDSKPHYFFSSPPSQSQMLSPLVSIGPQWREIIQRRTFESIYIRIDQDISHLAGLVELLQARKQLGTLIQRFCLSSGEKRNETATGHLEKFPHLLFLLITASPFVYYADISIIPVISLKFSAEDDSMLRSRTFLSNLTTFRFSAGQQDDFHRQLFDSIIATAPRIKHMNLNSNISTDYVGLDWTSELSYLKLLTISGPAMEAILSQKLWSIDRFSGLESLEVTNVTTDFHLPLPSLSLLANLKHFNTSATHGLDPSFLPPSLKTINFNACIPDSRFPSWSALPLVEEIYFPDFGKPLDLSILPPHHALHIGRSTSEVVLESLKNVEVKKAPFEEVTFGPEDYSDDNESVSDGEEFGGIIERCKELKINSVKFRTRFLDSYQGN